MTATYPVDANTSRQVVINLVPMCRPAGSWAKQLQTCCLPSLPAQMKPTDETLPYPVHWRFTGQGMVSSVLTKRLHQEPDDRRRVSAAKACFQLTAFLYKTQRNMLFQELTLLHMLGRQWSRAVSEPQYCVDPMKVVYLTCSPVRGRWWRRERRWSTFGRVTGWSSRR